MLLSALESNEFYQNIVSIIENRYHNVELEDLNVFVTINTYHKSTSERIILSDYTQEQVLLELNISEHEFNELKNENHIQVVSDNVTLDLMFSLSNNSLLALFITFYKVEE